jgi:hypothetical protein
VACEGAGWRNRGTTVGTVPRGRWVAVMLVAAATLAPVPVLAAHLREWDHDHSRRGIPNRPRGYSQLVNMFGRPCSDRADDARTWFPSALGRNRDGYVKHHRRLARNIGYNIRLHIEAAHRKGAVDYLVSGYFCRHKRGSTEWSTHAFGVAVDTNTARNPAGQNHWNGRGADGIDYGKYLPWVWKGPDPGHRFLWGMRWDDPHHFQYVTGY